MNRLSVEYQTNDVHSVEFNAFRSKNSQTIHYDSQNSFTVFKNSNSLGLGLLVAYLLNRSIQTIPCTSFSSLSFQQIPRNFIPYQHPQTLKSIFNLTLKKISEPQLLCEMINCYPVVQFVLNCYFRCLVMDEIERINGGERNVNFSDVQFHGNQEQLLSDYGVTIRGNLLNIGVLCLNTHFQINYERANDLLVQSYGKLNNLCKIEVFVNDSGTHRFSIQNSQLMSANKIKVVCDYSRQSYCRITPPSPVFKNINQERINPQSKSVSKQNQTNLCDSCKRKAMFCLCNSSHAKNIKFVDRKNGLNSSYSLVSPLNSYRSNIQPQQQNFVKQINDIRCKCNRCYCRYCNSAK